MRLLLLIGAGGFLGSISRYLVHLGVGKLLPVVFPYGTLIINIFGSLLIGVIYGLSDRTGTISNEWRFFLATGFCGGFTTFSAFSYETYSLLRHGEYLLSVSYILLSVVLGVLATVAAVALVRSI